MPTVVRDWTVYSADQPRAWADALKRVPGWDVYHTLGFQQLATGRGAGEPLLLDVQIEDDHVLLPLLRRELPVALRSVASGAFDATSAYGYPGLLCSRPAEQRDAAWREAFREGFSAACDALELVSVFVRQHPFVSTGDLFAGWGDVRVLGPTVVIDLQRSEEAERQQTRENHRRNLRKIAKHEPSYVVDDQLARVDLFRDVYEATMRRHAASDSYFFPDEYYTSLATQLKGHATLFYSLIDGQPAAAAIALHGGEWLHYHLGGGADAFAKMGPLRGVLDYIRRWGREQGYRWYHLGGGVGASEDSLFRFKSDFSKERRDYSVVRYVHRPELYAALCRRVNVSEDEDFFPAYRRA